MKVARVLAGILVVAAAHAASGAEPARPATLPPGIPWSVLPPLRFQRGDEPAWAAKAFDDSGWPQVGWGELPSRDGTYWVRWRVVQTDPNRVHTRDGLLC